MATYNLFISHAWHRNEHYNRIVEWLDNSIILWRNYSVPEHDPLDANNASKLKAALTEQIRHASAVIILAGMYANYSGLIDYEIDEAVRMGKPIIAVEPWGQERIPYKISSCATVIVGWNSSSVINAIRMYAC